MLKIIQMRHGGDRLEQIVELMSLYIALWLKTDCLTSLLIIQARISLNYFNGQDNITLTRTFI